MNKIKNLTLYSMPKTRKTKIWFQGILGVKLFSFHKDLNLLKFGSGDFIFSTYWNHRFCFTENQD
jgi:hypothetical protein